jgi:hypothetical protein
MEKQRKTFLSYSRANKDFALRLARELKTEGFNIWLDQLDIPAGSRWDREVERALKESEIFMIILTPASINSENVLDEIGYAIDTGKRFLPVLLEPCDVPLRLRRFQYVDFTNKSFDEGVESAKDLLRNLIAQTSVPLRENPAAAQHSIDQAEKARQAKAQTDRFAAERAAAEHKARGRPAPDAMRAEPLSRSATQKKSSSSGLLIGFILLVLLVGAGIVYAMWPRNGNNSSPTSNPATEAPTVVNPVTEAPVATEAPATEAPATEPHVVNPITEAPVTIEVPNNQNNGNDLGTVADFSGHWYLNFGEMDLQQNGTQVNGYYDDPTRGTQGNIEGAIDGQTLNAQWTEGISSGQLTLHLLDKTESTMSGETSEKVLWCGARNDVPFPDGCSFAGTWHGYIDKFDCPMNLTLINTMITGGDCNGQITGTLSHGLGLTYISGASGGILGGSFLLYLVDNQGLQFRGSYGPNNEYEWCGWRETSSMPSPCYYK